MLSALTACEPADLHERAARFDRHYATNAFTWLVDHEPSRLDVVGLPLAVVAPFDRSARLRAGAADLRAACREAKSDRALLLTFVGSGDTLRRAVALDCGFALERDPGALVLAPR